MPMAAAELISDDALDLGEGQRQAAAAEALQIGKAGMRANSDAVPRRQRYGGMHHIRIAGMKPAGNIGRADDAEHRRIIAHRPGPKASRGRN